MSRTVDGRTIAQVASASSRPWLPPEGCVSFVSAPWTPDDDIRQVGEEPDYRFTLANERTFLSYVRTALAFFAAGTAILSFFDRVIGERVLVVVIGSGLSPSACSPQPAVTGAGAGSRWQ